MILRFYPLNLFIAACFVIKATGQELTIPQKVKLFSTVTGYLGCDVHMYQYVDKRKGVSIGLQVDSATYKRKDNLKKLMDKYQYLVMDFVLDDHPIDQYTIQFYVLPGWRLRYGTVFNVKRMFFRLKTKTSLQEKCDILKDVFSFPVEISTGSLYVRCNVQLPDGLLRRKDYFYYGSAMAELIKFYILHNESGFSTIRINLKSTTGYERKYDFNVNKLCYQL